MTVDSTGAARTDLENVSAGYDSLMQKEDKRHRPFRSHEVEQKARAVKEQKHLEEEEDPSVVARLRSQEKAARDQYNDLASLPGLPVRHNHNLESVKKVDVEVQSQVESFESNAHQQQGNQQQQIHLPSESKDEPALQTSMSENE